MVGSAPVKIENQTATIGGRPLVIGTKERIVAVNASDEKYALWYYQTPASYVAELASAYALDVTFVMLEDFGQMNRAVDAAHKVNATVLATRVFDRSDYDAVRHWLNERAENRAFLFHSASYPLGKRLMAEYPNQTSFDDPNPVVI
jgi:hypothetical protein